MKLRIALEDKKFDVRLMDRHLAEGKIQNDELKVYYTKIDDNKTNYEETKVGKTIERRPPNQ